MEELLNLKIMSAKTLLPVTKHRQVIMDLHFLRKEECVPRSGSTLLLIMHALSLKELYSENLTLEMIQVTWSCRTPGTRCTLRLELLPNSQALTTSSKNNS